MRIIVLAKEKPGLSEAIRFLRNYSSEVVVAIGNRSDPFPKELFIPEPDILVSYLSPWIVPSEVLKMVKLASVNFHPGPPAYPGSGCTNFAIYNNEPEFGVTAHYMLPGVDSGDILKVSRFEMLPSYSVMDLTIRCYEEIINIFPEVMKKVIEGDLSADQNEKWSRKPYTRRELDELCRITIDMSEEEVKRRVKATYYPGMPGPYIEMAGLRFEYKNYEKK